MFKVRAQVKGIGTLKTGRDEAYFQDCCAREQGTVKSLELNPRGGETEFAFEIVFDIAGAGCCSNEGIAKWRTGDILDSMFSDYMLQEGVYEEL